MKLFSLDFLFNTLLLFAVLFVVPLFFSFDMFEPLDNLLSDLRITDIVDSKIVDRDQLQADTNMVLINTQINNEDISNLGLAKVINIINKYEPKIIGVKKIIEKSDNPQQDSLLVKVLGNAKNLVMMNRFYDYNPDNNEFDSIDNSDGMFTKEATFGYDNYLFSKDERFLTIRTFAPRLKAQGKTELSFALKVAELYNPKKGEELVKRNKKSEIISYLGHYQFFRMDAMDVLNENFAPDLIKNKIVLLGRISTKDAIDSNMAINDVFFTPLNNTYTGKAFPDMYGTIIQANIISMILNAKYFTSMPVWLIYVISVLLVYFNMVLFTFITVIIKKWYEILSIAVFVLESIIMLGATMFCFISLKYDMNLTIPVISTALSAMLYEVYNSSLKPITIKAYYKFFHKG